MNARCKRNTDTHGRVLNHKLLQSNYSLTILYIFVKTTIRYPLICVLFFFFVNFWSMCFVFNFIFIRDTVLLLQSSYFLTNRRICIKIHNAHSCESL